MHVIWDNQNVTYCNFECCTFNVYTVRDTKGQDNYEHEVPVVYVFNSVYLIHYCVSINIHYV